jgi:hypothetical protein
MKTLLILLLSTCLAFAQLNISNPFYVAPILKPAAAASGITFVGSATNDFSGTSTTLSVPSGTASGDFILFVCATDTGHYISNFPSGFTLTESNILAQAGFTAAWKISDGSEGSSIQFDFVEASEQGASILAVWRNVNATPVDADSVSTQAITGGDTITTPALLPSANNCVVIGVAWSDPTGVPDFSEVSGFPFLAESTRSGLGVIALAHRIQTTATSEGVQLISSETDTIGIYTIVIKP